MRCRSLYITHEPKEKKFHLGVSSWYTFSATLAFVLKKTWVNVTINYTLHVLFSHPRLIYAFLPTSSFKTQSLKKKKKKKEKTLLYLYLLSLSVCLWLKKQNLHVYSLSFCWLIKQTVYLFQTLPLTTWVGPVRGNKGIFKITLKLSLAQMISHHAGSLL